MPHVSRLPTPVLAALAALVVLVVSVAVLMHMRGSSPAASTGAPTRPSPAPPRHRSRRRRRSSPTTRTALSALNAARRGLPRPGAPDRRPVVEHHGHRGRAARPGGRPAQLRRPRRDRARSRSPATSSAEALVWARRSLAVAPTRVAPLGVARRRPDRARPLRRGLRHHRPAARAAPRPALLQPRLLRPRAPGRPGQRHRPDAAWRSTPAGPAPRRAPGRGCSSACCASAAATSTGPSARCGGRSPSGPATRAPPPGSPACSPRAGELDRAAALYSRAIDRVPLPEYPAALAEIHLAQGGPRPRARTSRWSAPCRSCSPPTAPTSTSTSRPSTPTSACPDAADIARARRGRAARPGVIGDQVLGWVLTRAGRCAEGDRYRHAQPAPGHARRPDALPGRHGRLLRRPRGRRPAAAVRRPRPEPRPSRCAGPRWPGASWRGSHDPAGRLLVAVVALAALLAGAVAQASAHPLGNFTVNSYLRVEASGGRALPAPGGGHGRDPHLPRALDGRRSDGGLAPYAARAGRRARAARSTSTVDGRRATVVPISQTAGFRPGAGGLQVLRYAAWYRATGVARRGGRRPTACP